MYDKLPSELKENALFCLWKYEERDGKIQRCPIRSTADAQTTQNRKTFSDYQSVVANLSVMTV
jgi:putative DNA primase/helicase